MHLPPFTPLILTVGGILLVAWEASRKDRRPLLAALGVTVAALSIPAHLIGHGLLHGAISLATDFGVGLVLAAGLLKVRHVSGRNLFTIGLLLLLAATSTRIVVKTIGGSHSGTPLLGYSETASDADMASILVELGPDDSIDELRGILDQFDVRYERAFPTVSLDANEDLAQVYYVSGAIGMLKKLLALLRRELENVDNVAFNDFVGLLPPVEATTRLDASTAAFLPNDPLVKQQWAYTAADMDSANELLRDTTPERVAVVAILDTGVDSRHEDIRGPFLDSPGATDQHGHGTHCAGIAGAATNNGLGIASLNWGGTYVQISSYRALGSTGMGTVESIAQAIIDATTDGADVISMSLGDFAPFPPKVVVDAVKFALQRDVIIVAAAGNSNQDGGLHMPSNIDGVISVAAVDRNLRKASFSNTNSSLTRPLAAPGVDILSLGPNGQYLTKSGTSMATPLVAGLVGVLRAIDQSITADQAYNLLKMTGKAGPDVSRTGRTVQAKAAIEALLDVKSGRRPVVATAP